MPFSIYRFEPSEFVELVEDGQKSQYGLYFEEYNRKKEERRQLADERRRTNELLKQKMKEPLNGNLALNFLFKNSDIGELIKAKSGGASESGFIDVSRATARSDNLY